MKLLINFIVIVFFCNVSNAQVVIGKITNEQIVKSWSSFILDISGEKSARMSTFSKSRSGEGVTLAINMFPPCTGLSMRFIYTLNKPIVESLQFKYLLTMRVDSNQPLFGEIVYDASPGDKMALFTLNTLPQFPDILSNMITGQKIYMRVDDMSGKAIDTISFSLYGFTAGYNRMDKLCSQIIQNPNHSGPSDLENLRQIPKDPVLPPNPNVPSSPVLPKHPNSKGV